MAGSTNSAEPAPLEQRDEGPIVHTARLIMRPLGQQDLHAMHDIFSRDETLRYMHVCAAALDVPPLPLTPSSAKNKPSLAERVDWLALRSEPPAFNFALVLRSADGTPAGPAIGALGSPRSPPMVGYGVHPDVWGQGLVSEALAAYEALFWAWVPSCDGTSKPPVGDFRLGPMAKAVIAGPAYDYMHAFCDELNVGSRRVLEKAGFTLVRIVLENFEGVVVMTCRYVKPRPGKTLADVGIKIEL